MEGEATRKDERPSVSTEDARTTLGELVSRAGYGNERIVITRHGKPVAALVGLRDLESLDRVA